MAVEAGTGTLSQQTVSGLSWQVLANVIRFGAQFGIGIALARLLPPEDFGIVGLAYIATGFASILAGLGLGPALIQRGELTERHIRVCQTLSLGMSVVMTAVLYSTADSIAAFFHDVRLAAVLRVLAFTFLFTGLGITSRALLTRRLAFKTLVKIELFASIVGYGGVSITMAVAGFGYWSLVGGMLVQTALSSLAQYIAARHTLRPLLARAETRDLLGFSAGVSLEGIVNYFALQGDYFVVGRMMDAVSLGFYSRAYTLMQLPQSFLGTALSRVLFPAASRVQADEERFRRAYLTVFSLSICISLPISLGMVILAPELVLMLYGETWAPVIPILQILGLFGVFRMSYNNACAFIHAQGRTFGLVVSQAIYAVLVLGGSWWAASWGGLVGVAWAVGGAIFVMWTIVIALANRASGVAFGQFMRMLLWSLCPGLLLGLVLLVLSEALRALHIPGAFVLMLAGGVFGVATGVVLYQHARRLDHPLISSQLDRVWAIARRIRVSLVDRS